jgi:hypothetical protein
MTAHASRMTEPERRRAAGDPCFNSSPGMVRIAGYILDDMARGRLASGELSAFGHDVVAAQLRALVLQELVAFALSWGES